jgi:hypothetical protein
MNTETIVIAVLVAAIVIGAVAWYFARRQRSERLRDKFGPEYDRTVNTMRSQDRAEAELSKREKRLRNYTIVALPATDQARYREEWLGVQSGFVDRPESAVAEAHRLVQEVMRRCGYPLADFEQSAADLSVDHPHVVENYRAANRIAQRGEGAPVSTEELREALVHYRALFEDLLGSEEPRREEDKRETDWRGKRRKRPSPAQPSH